MSRAVVLVPRSRLPSRQPPYDDLVSNEPAIAAGPDGTREGFVEHVAQVARERGAAWDALAEVLGEPRDAVVDRLRSGALVAQWRTGSAWHGEESRVFTASLMSLDVYVRGAARRDPADDARSYRAEQARLVSDPSGLAARVADLAERCRTEAEVWASGDLVGGREARAAQHALLADGLAERLIAIGSAAAERAETHLWRTLGKVVIALVTVESGRDYSAVLGSAARRRRD